MSETDMPKLNGNRNGIPKPSKWEVVKKEALAKEFEANDGNISKTAVSLGMARNTVLKHLKKFKLYKPKKKTK